MVNMSETSRKLNQRLFRKEGLTLLTRGFIVKHVVITIKRMVCIATVIIARLAANIIARLLGNS